VGPLGPALAPLPVRFLRPPARQDSERDPERFYDSLLQFELAPRRRAQAPRREGDFHVLPGCGSAAVSPVHRWVKQPVNSVHRATSEQEIGDPDAWQHVIEARGKDLSFWRRRFLDRRDLQHTLLSMTSGSKLQVECAPMQPHHHHYVLQNILRGVSSMSFRRRSVWTAWLLPKPKVLELAGYSAFNRT